MRSGGARAPSKPLILHPWQGSFSITYGYKPDAQVLQVLCVCVDDVHELGIRGVQVHLRLGTFEEQLARGPGLPTYVCA